MLFDHFSWFVTPYHGYIDDFMPKKQSPCPYFSTVTNFLHLKYCIATSVTQTTQKSPGKFFYIIWKMHYSNLSENV